MSIIIPNWKAALGHYSTVAMAAGMAFAGIWTTTPEVHALVPAKVAVAINGAIFAAGLVGKFISQTKAALEQPAPAPLDPPAGSEQ